MSHTIQDLGLVILQKHCIVLRHLHPEPLVVFNI